MAGGQPGPAGRTRARKKVRADWLVTVRADPIGEAVRGTDRHSAQTTTPDQAVIRTSNPKPIRYHAKGSKVWLAM